MICWDRCFQGTEEEEHTSLHQSHCTLVEHAPTQPCCSYPCLWTSTINICPQFQPGFLETYCLEQIHLEIEIAPWDTNPKSGSALCSVKSSMHWCISKTRLMRVNSTNYTVIFLKAVKGFYKNIWGFMPHELCNLKLSRYCIKASKQQL